MNRMINMIVDYRDPLSKNNNYLISNVITMSMMAILFPLCLVKGFLRMRVRRFMINRIRY